MGSGSIPNSQENIPLWLKIFSTIFLAVLIPLYWIGFGPVNFLWFSDIALFVTCLALWRESSFLISMTAAGTLLPEIVWSLDFLLHWMLGQKVTGVAAYMFDPAMPLHLRILSGFHLLLPPVLLWALYRLGYDRTAWKAQAALSWIILPVSYLLSDPEHNVNWVYGPGMNQEFLPDPLYVILLMMALPILIILPTHGILRKLYPQ